MKTQIQNILLSVMKKVGQIKMVGTAIARIYVKHIKAKRITLLEVPNLWRLTVYKILMAEGREDLCEGWKPNEEDK